MINNTSHNHKPVMCEQVIQSLNIKENSKIVDATFGRGGHSMAILKKLSANGRIIAFDKDLEAINYAKKHYHDSRLELNHNSFIDIETILANKNMLGNIDGILMDLGVSSPQLDNANRGFSFQNNGPLDMRMDTREQQTVATWLVNADKDEIADVLYKFGEEKKSRQIASAIKLAQKSKVITTTAELANIISGVIPRYKQKKHPATRSFQALRIFINNELTELEIMLDKLIKCLVVGGRITIISFHSLEDRIVKRFIARNSKAAPLPKNLPIIDKDVKMPLKSIGRYFATTQELTENIRARSAILRVAEKI